MFLYSVSQTNVNKQCVITRLKLIELITCKINYKSNTKIAKINTIDTTERIKPQRDIARG